MPSRKQLAQAMLVSAVASLGFGAMYFDAQNAKWPIIGVNAGFTRTIAILGGLMFGYLLLRGTHRLLFGPGPIPPATRSTARKHPVATESWERPQTRLAYLLPEHGIREGHVPTLTEVKRLIADLKSEGRGVPDDDPASEGRQSPWTRPNDPTVYAEMWLDAAPPQALGPLLVCLDEGDHLLRGQEDDPEFEDSFYEPVEWFLVLLSGWGRRHPHPWLEEVGARLDDPGLRPSALFVLGVHGMAEAFRYLAPWARRAGELSKTEIRLLGEALDSIGTDAARKLSRQLP